MWDSIKQYFGGLTLADKVAHLGMLIITGVTALLLYWLLAPYDVYELKTPYEVITPVVSAGDTVEIRQVYCKKLRLPATVHISLVDGYVEPLRTIISNVDPACYDRISKTVIIPQNTVPGEYKIRYTFLVRVNPIREVVYTAESEAFTVK